MFLLAFPNLLDTASHDHLAMPRAVNGRGGVDSVAYFRLCSVQLLVKSELMKRGEYARAHAGCCFSSLFCSEVMITVSIGFIPLLILTSFSGKNFFGTFRSICCFDFQCSDLVY